MKNSRQLFYEGLTMLGLDKVQVEAIADIAAVLFEGAADLVQLPIGKPIPRNTLYTTDRNKLNRIMNICLLKDAGVELPTDALAISDVIRQNEGKYGVSRTHSIPELKEWVANNSHTIIDGNTELLDSRKEMMAAKARDNEFRSGANAVEKAVGEFDDENEVGGPKGYNADDENITKMQIKQAKKDIQSDEGDTSSDVSDDATVDAKNSADAQILENCVPPTEARDEIKYLANEMNASVYEEAYELTAMPELSAMILGTTAGSMNDTGNAGILGRFVNGDISLMAEYKQPTPEKYGVPAEQFEMAADILSHIGRKMADFDDEKKRVLTEGYCEAMRIDPKSKSAPKTQAEQNKVVTDYVCKQFAKDAPMFKLSNKFIDGVLCNFAEFVKYLGGASATPPFTDKAPAKAAAKKTGGRNVMSANERFIKSSIARVVGNNKKTASSQPAAAVQSSGNSELDQLLGAF